MMPSFAPHKSMHDVSQIEIGVEAKMKNDQRYNALRNVDEQSDTSTEVGEWEPEGDVKPQRSGRRTIWRSFSRYRWLLDTALLLVIVGLLAENKWFHDRGHRYEFAGDVTGFAPTCKSTQSGTGRRLLTTQVSQQIVTFRPNPIFAPENASEFWNRDVQQAWLDIVPGMYIVRLHCPARCANSQQKGWVMSRSRILRGMTIFHSQSMTMSTTLYSRLP